MASNNLKPHVPPEAAPDVVIQLLKRLIEQNQTFDTVKELREFSGDMGLGDRPEVPIFMTSIGLLTHGTKGTVGPSESARLLLQNEEKALADLVHFLIWSGWSQEKPRERSDLWGYRQVTTVFWERAPIDVLSLTDYVTEEIRNKALLQFGEDVSFSPKSIRGVRKWLEALTPPVLEENHFRRRNYVHPQVLLLATGWVARNSDAEIGIDMLLTPERREAICRLCLLEPSALDQSLDWMLPLYTHVLDPGTTAGIYGRFLRFYKWPSLSDLTFYKR